MPKRYGFSSPPPFSAPSEGAQRLSLALHWTDAVRLVPNSANKFAPRLRLGFV